jgi:hypothetical protein
LVGWCVFDLADPTATGIDQLEAAMVDSGLPRVECPIVHRFTPGLYTREISIPAGTLLTSMEHKLEHPFVLSKGRIKVTSDTEGSVVYDAPHTGITQPGTRRALFAETDVVWTTFHVTDLTDVEAIGEAILAPHHNPFLANNDPALEAWRLSLPTTNLPTS